jgi:dihydroorotate dehydrogenase
MIYSVLKRLLFLRDPERVHDQILARLATAGNSAAGRALLHSLAGASPSSPVHAMGLLFPHPIGLAAGFDKNAVAIPALQALNFSFLEIGTVTPRPQSGNPKPRVWRFPEANALVNALGFPGEGMNVVRERLEELRERKLIRVPIGINLGKNKDTSAESAPSDYLAVFRELSDAGDYFVVNVSSPNTPGLRDMQSVESLKLILHPLLELRAKSPKPLLVKIAPDLSNDDVIAIARLVREFALDGIVSANTTINRAQVPRAASLDRGGLSGSPLYPRTLHLAKLLRSELKAEQTLIAVGGIDSAGRVKEMLEAGANLIQIYTAFIYEGPRAVRNLLEGIG